MSSHVSDSAGVIQDVRAALAEFAGAEVVEGAKFEVGASFGSDVVIRIETEDPSRLLGQFVPFDVDSYGGYALPYVRGWVAAARVMRAIPAIKVHLDVHGRVANRARDVYSLVSLEDILAAAAAEDRAFARRARDAGARLALIVGNVIAGPSLAMLASVGQMLEREAVDAVIDGYSGSCGVAAVALSRGVASVTSVDVRDWPEARTQFAGESRWSFVWGDTLEVLGRRTSACPTLLSLDPFYGHTLRVAKAITPDLTGNARVVLNGGPSYMRAWQDRIHEALRRHYEVSWEDAFDERIYRLRPSQDVER